MSSFEELKRAVLRKAEEEAAQIVKRAEEEAVRIIREAEEARLKMIEEARRKIASDLKYEQRVAEAKAGARKILAEAKARVLSELNDLVFKLLDDLGDSKRYDSLKKLVEEALQAVVALGGKRFVVRISSRDLKFAEMLMKDIASKFASQNIEISIEPAPIRGGVIVEDVTSGVIIDNSYETRLKKLLSSKAPEIQRRLFGT